MEDKIDYIEPLLQRAEQYGRTSIELFKLKALDKAAGVVSAFVSQALVALLLFLFIIMASTGAALWLGELLGKSYQGFLCVAGFYIIVAVVLYFFMGNPIKRKTGDAFVSQILN